MKTIFVLLVTLLSVSAQARLEPFFGRVQADGFNYTCTFHNNTGSALNMKYVVFTFMNLGDSADYDVQVRIDRTVRAGGTIRETVTETGAYSIRSCHYLAR